VRSIENEKNERAKKQCLPLTRSLFVSLRAPPTHPMTDKDAKKGDAAKKGEADAEAVSAPAPAPAVEGDDLFEEFELPGGEKSAKGRGRAGLETCPRPCRGAGSVRPAVWGVRVWRVVRRGGGGAARNERHSSAREPALFPWATRLTARSLSLPTHRPAQGRGRSRRRRRGPPTLGGGVGGRGRVRLCGAAEGGAGGAGVK